MGITIGSERKCTLCNSIKDKFHCLFMCLRYENERLGMFRIYLLGKASLSVSTINSKNIAEMSKRGEICTNIQMKHSYVSFKCIHSCFFFFF